MTKKIGDELDPGQPGVSTNGPPLAPSAHVPTEGWGVREEDANKERRLALLLADGSGDFDFVRVFGIQNWVVLEGKVKRYGDKERAEAIARDVGFASIVNTIRVSL